MTHFNSRIVSETIFSTKIKSEDKSEDRKIKKEPIDNNDTERTLALPLLTNNTIKKSKTDEMATLIMEIEQARTEYFKNQLVFKALKETVFDNNPKLPLNAKKVRQIIIAEEVAKLSDLNLGGKDQNIPLNIVGLKEHHKDCSNVTLSYSEKIKLASVVEEKLTNNCSKIQNLNLSKGNETSHRGKCIKDVFSSEKIELLKKADSQLLKLNETLSSYRNIIKDLSEMRLGLSGKVNSEMIPWFEAQCECLQLEAKVLEKQIYIHTFKENPSMLEAAKKICDNLQKEYDEKSQELEKLKKLEESYNSLEGTEFDNVLRTYKEYKQRIEYLNFVTSELSWKK